MWHCLRDRKFSYFDTIPACDRQSDRQTEGQQTQNDSIYRSSIALHGKKTKKAMLNQWQHQAWAKGS